VPHGSSECNSGHHYRHSRHFVYQHHSNVRHHHSTWNCCKSVFELLPAAVPNNAGDGSLSNSESFRVLSLRILEPLFVQVNVRCWGNAVDVARVPAEETPKRIPEEPSFSEFAVSTYEPFFHSKHITSAELQRKEDLQSPSLGVLFGKNTDWCWSPKCEQCIKVWPCCGHFQLHI
jgi:hypothetical protein